MSLITDALPVGKKNPEVTIRAMCRGEGVAYLSFDVPDAPGTLSVDVCSKGGVSVPSTLLPFEQPGHGKWVAVFPQLAEDVRLSICRDAVEQASLVFPAARSKLWSRLLTLTKPQVAEALRGIECRRGAGRAQVRITEAWPASEGRVAWRVRVTLPATDHMPEPLLVAYDDHARQVDAHVVTMEDHIVPDERDATRSVRLVTFSCVLPEEVTSFFVVANPGDAQLEGFAGMNAPRARGMVADARVLTAGAAADGGYERWFEEHRVTDAELEWQRRRSACMPEAERPLISIVMPVFRTPPEFLRAAIASMRAQSYDRWELVLVNASGPDEGVDGVLAEVRDERVRVIEVPNRSIAQNTNAGIEVATGDYVGFLDHDDVMEPDALWHYVQAIRREPHADLLYCDEDRLEGTRVHTPAFKTFPNYGKLYGHNYVTHLLMVSRFVLERTERSGADVSGAQDYDLTLKAFEVVREVVHVPRVLYHWREHEGSTAGGSDQKPYAHEAGKRALQAHLARRGIDACVEDGQLPYTYRVRYELPTPAPRVSIVIPTRDHADLLRACVSSILERTTYPDFEVVLVENSSEDARTFALYDGLCARDDRVSVVTWTPPEPGAFNYSAIVNHGVAHSSGELIVLLNNDTEVIEPRWLEYLAGELMRPEVGVVGAKLLFGDGLIQHVGMVANSNADFCHVCQNLEADAVGPSYAVAFPGDYAMVTGACQMMRRALFDELGGYDEHLTVGFNDGDFCLRARQKGYVSTVCADAVLYHREFSSRGRESSDDRLRARYLTEKGRMLTRHAAFFAKGDPSLNPNLDGYGTFFGL